MTKAVKIAIASLMLGSINDLIEDFRQSSDPEEKKILKAVIEAKIYMDSKKAPSVSPPPPPMDDEK